MNPQLSAAPYDISIHSQREAAALGTYRIKLEHIKLPVIPDDRQRNVSRLKRIFQRQKILRLEPFNSITATIDATVFNRRAGRVDEHVTNLLGKPPELLLSLDEEVQCIHGKCRIKAADSILKGRDRWWTVSLYRTDIDHRAKRYLNDKYSNEQPPSDGQIYLDLYKSRTEGDRAREDRCWAYLTTSKRKYLKGVFNHHRNIIDALDGLAPIKDLFLHQGAFWLGNFHTIAGLRCDEEVISYINDTGYFWSTITKNGEYRVTTSFIREVQGRCPRLSQRDHKCLQRALTTEGALSYLPQNAREHIYRNIIQYNHTIPSLYTLFEDLKYIKQCRDVLKKLVTGDKYLPKGQTLKKCFLKHFQASPRPIIQTNHRVFEEADGLPQNIYFLVAYWQIWLCAMRYWPDCLTRSARKVPEAEDQCFESSLRPQFWTLMGKSALRLGFNSPRINAFASGHEELSMDSQVCYPGFTAEADREHWERYGIPYEDKHLYDRNSLFIQRLLVPQQQVGSIGAGEDITTLFVRRTLFLRLFPETKSLMQGSPPQSQGSPQVRQSQRLSDEPVVPTPISSALARIDHHLQRSTISTTPRNVSPSQEVEMTDHRTGPEGGDYIVERWTPQGSETLRTETRDNWLNILRTLQRKKYLLYEVGLKALDGSQLAQYRGKKLIAAHPKVTHNSIRQAYGLST